MKESFAMALLTEASKNDLKECFKENGLILSNLKLEISSGIKGSLLGWVLIKLDVEVEQGEKMLLGEMDKLEKWCSSVATWQKKIFKEFCDPTLLGRSGVQVDVAQIESVLSSRGLRGDWVNAALSALSRADMEKRTRRVVKKAIAAL